ncbi:MAG: hypothetical protein JNM27_09725 [Leptospirales bacterium]|nr:hypothetical protein [Leptospirales bacterium]
MRLEKHPHFSLKPEHKTARHSLRDLLTKNNIQEVDLDLENEAAFLIF